MIIIINTKMYLIKHNMSYFPQWKIISAICSCSKLKLKLKSCVGRDSGKINVIKIITNIVIN